VVYGGKSSSNTGSAGILSLLTFTAILSAMLATRGGLMAKPNYQFEKRQRDLAKKSKQEEKRRQKQAEKPGGSSGENETASPSSAPSHERT
jgi:hypothetical protein